jgi:hypothetical protein
MYRARENILMPTIPDVFYPWGIGFQVLIAIPTPQSRRRDASTTFNPRSNAVPCLAPKSSTWVSFHVSHDQGLHSRFVISKNRFVDQNLTFVFLNLKPKYINKSYRFCFSVHSGKEKNYRISLVTERKGNPCPWLIGSLNRLLQRPLDPPHTHTRIHTKQARESKKWDGT